MHASGPRGPVGPIGPYKPRPLPSPPNQAKQSRPLPVPPRPLPVGPRPLPVRPLPTPPRPLTIRPLPSPPIAKIPHAKAPPLLNRLLKKAEHINWSTLPENKALEKLTDIAQKMIAIEEKTGIRISKETMDALEKAIRTESKKAQKGETYIQALNYFFSTLHKEKVKVQEDKDPLVARWSPNLISRGKISIKKYITNLDLVKENLIQLKKILPDVEFDPGLLKIFDENKREITAELTKLEKFSKDTPFHEIVLCLSKIEKLKTQLKNVETLIRHSLKTWEANVGEKVKIAIDRETEITREYGYKHARHLELAHIIPQVNVKGVSVDIPQGLSNTQIQKFLSKNAGEITKYWKDLNRDFLKYKQANPKEPASSFLKQPDVVNKLDKIHKMISHAFSLATKDPEVNSKELRAWLDSMNKEGKHLMVRSSSTEDTRKTANAGGNVSVAYVKPEIKEFLEAVSDVVLSYYSTGSLQNIINSDLNPFESPLRLAVSAEELIGEKVGGEKDPKKIPISVVLFSNEPTYVGNEPFRVMRISATFGHGEGVVGAVGIKSDTILLLQSVKHPDQLYVLEDNQVKPQRLAPVKDPSGKIRLEKIDNPSELVERSALNKEMLTRLFYLGVGIERVYGNHPVDMELVILEGNIKPVQVRPVNRPLANPTYLDIRKVKKQTLKIEPFLAGRAEAQVIQTADHILISDNLENAQKLFKKGIHQIVIVREEEPANSHPVVNFSGMGIPVMYHENLEEIKTFVKKINKDSGLIACVQSGTLALYEKKEKAENYIRSGYTVHPARVAISLDSSRLPPVTQTTPAEMPEELKSLLVKVRALDTQEIALEAVGKLKEQQTSIRERREHLIQRMPKNDAPQHAKQLVGSLEKLENTYRDAVSELKATLKKTQGQRLNPLLHTKVVETLFKQPEAPRALGRFSVMNLASQHSAVEKILDYKQKFNFPTVFHDHVLDCDAFMTPEQEGNWISFLTNLEQSYQSKSVSKNDVVEFKSMLMQLREMGLMPLWTCRFFLPEYQRSIGLNQKSPQLANKLTSLFTFDTKNHLKEMKTTLQQINDLKDQLSAFSEPAKFDQAWKQLGNVFDKLACKDDTLKTRLEALSPLARIATYQVMKEFVDLFDLAIKQVKASTAYTDQEKGQRFSTMLDGYFDLLEGWVNKLTGQHLKYHPDWDKKAYLDKVKEILKKTDNSPSQFIASVRFTVFSSILGMETAFDRSLPVTKEDVFTLIHQNLLYSLEVLFGIEMKNQTILPASVDSVAQVISDHSLPVQLVGFDFPPNKIVLHYNYPLRNHSATFEVIFDKMTQECYVDVKFLGLARERWDTIEAFLKISNTGKLITLKNEIVNNDLMISYSVKLTKEQDMVRAFRDLRNFADYSMRGQGVISALFFRLYEVVEIEQGKETAIHTAIEYLKNISYDDGNAFRRYSEDFLNVICEQEKDQGVLIKLIERLVDENILCFDPDKLSLLGENKIKQKVMGMLELGKINEAINLLNHVRENQKAQYIDILFDKRIINALDDKTISKWIYFVGLVKTPYVLEQTKKLVNAKGLPAKLTIELLHLLINDLPSKEIIHVLNGLPPDTQSSYVYRAVIAILIKRKDFSLNQIESSLQRVFFDHQTHGFSWSEEKIVFTNFARDKSLHAFLHKLTTEGLNPDRGIETPSAGLAIALYNNGYKAVLPNLKKLIVYLSFEHLPGLVELKSKMDVNAYLELMKVLALNGRETRHEGTVEVLNNSKMSLEEREDFIRKTLFREPGTEWNFIDKINDKSNIDLILKICLEEIVKVNEYDFYRLMELLEKLSDTYPIKIDEIKLFDSDFLKNIIGRSADSLWAHLVSNLCDVKALSKPIFHVFCNPDIPNEFKTNLAEILDRRHSTRLHNLVASNARAEEVQKELEKLTINN